MASDIFTFVNDMYLNRHFMVAEDADRVPLRPLKRQALADRHADRRAWELATLRLGSEENQLAYELNIAIEQLGLAVWTGMVPLNVVLPLAADQLIEDWLLCKAWLDDYRLQKQTVAEDGTPFHRRHGEWLALVAWAWMDTAYPSYAPLREFNTLYSSAGPLADLRALNESEIDHPHPDVQQRVRDITDRR